MRIGPSAFAAVARRAAGTAGQAFGWASSVPAAPKPPLWIYIATLQLMSNGYQFS
jgi:hypothetical protein